MLGRLHCIPRPIWIKKKKKQKKTVADYFTFWLMNGAVERKMIPIGKPEVCVRSVEVAVLWV